MIMQSRLRKFTKLIGQYDRFYVTLVYDDEQVQAQRVTLSEAHSDYCPFQTKYSWPRIKGPSFSFFLENHIIDLMLNVEDESEHHFGDENRRCGLSQLPMFLVKYF